MSELYARGVVDGWEWHREDVADEERQLSKPAHLGDVQWLALGLHEWKGLSHKLRNPKAGIAPDDCDIDARAILEAARRVSEGASR